MGVHGGEAVESHHEGHEGHQGTLPASARRSTKDQLVRDRRLWRFDGPDLLDVVEGPDLGAEQVDDHVARVDQHPVAVGQALHTAPAIALVLEGAQQVVGQGRDVTVRAAGRDDQAVGDRALVLQVDEDDVLGLVVVQALEDQGFQLAGASLVVRRGLGLGRRLVRLQRGFTNQRFAPLDPTTAGGTLACRGPAAEGQWRRFASSGRSAVEEA